MASLQLEAAPLCEPVALTDMKNFLRVPFPDDDSLISMLITAARELCETFTARSFVNTSWRQGLDSFPYFTDTVMSQMAFPPSYYSLPRYSTTLWNYSQMIKLFVSPLYSVSSISYLSSADEQWHSLVQAPPLWYPSRAYAAGAQVTDGNGNMQTALSPGVSALNPPTWSKSSAVNTPDGSGSTAFQWQYSGPAVPSFVGPGSGTASGYWADYDSEPPRLFPGPAGSFWPSVLYVPEAVQIHFVSGYGPAIPVGSPVSGYLPPTGIPGRVATAIMQLVAGWYEHREAISPLTLKEMPNHVKALLWSLRVLDMQPTRG